MKFLFKLLKFIVNSQSLTGRLLKKIFNKIDNFLPIKYSYYFNSSDRPHYLYCCYNAALLAKKLGINKISVIELGVAGGNGIIFLEKIAKKIKKDLNIEIIIIGFDSGEGMYSPNENFDLPYFFKKGQFTMDKKILEEKLNSAKIIYGNIENTLIEYFNNTKNYPIGAILNDLDYYSSTCSSLKVYNYPNLFLPRVITYFDDTIGSEEELYTDAIGQLKAISEHNNLNNNKLYLNKNLLANSNEIWRYQIYYTHFFENKIYSKNIISSSYELKLEEDLKLKK